MRIVSLTRDLTNGVYYKNRAVVRFKTKTSGEVNESEFSCSSIHIGTHVDLPAHFSGEPYQGVDSMVFRSDEVIITKYDELYGKTSNDTLKVLLLDFGQEDQRNSEVYPFEFSAINESDLLFILKNFTQLEIIGTTNPSIGDPTDSTINKTVHKKFLIDNSVLVLEDVLLPDVIEPYDYFVLSMIPTSDLEARFCTVNLIMKS